MNIHNFISPQKLPTLAPVQVSSVPKPKDLIYYLPIPQSLIQRELIELLIQLHKPNFLKIFSSSSEDPMDIDNANDVGGDETEIETEDEKEPSKDTINHVHSDEVLNAQSMLELFTSNVKQVMNHSTLLVNHYIPKNLLLLDAKENIYSCSFKYKRLDDILNKLIQRKQSKTVIITAATSQELDLIESILIGKSGLQYYRFSGSSLYYEHHGSFNFNKDSPESDDELPIKNLTPGQPAGSGKVGAKKGRKPKSETTKGKQGRKKKSPGVKSSEPKGGRAKSSSSSSTTNNSTNNTNGNGVTSGHSHSNSLSNSANNSVSSSAMSTSNTSAGGTRPKHGDEYTPRISKNNPLFENLMAKSVNKKTSVYLIVSNQLKNLIEFEELKSDLIISLDSKLKQVSPNFSIPIIKPIVLNSIEYFENVLNTTDSKDLNYLKLLTRLIVVNRTDDVKYVSEDFESLEGLTDWILNSNIVEYPFDLNLPELAIPDNLNEKFEKSLINLQFSKVYDLHNYQYYNKSSSEDSSENGYSAKKIKLENIEDIDIPNRLIFRDYQRYLADLVYNRFREVLNSIDGKQSELLNLREDDSERQLEMELKNAKIGEFFKKLQSSNTKIEGLTRQSDKLKLDNENLSTISKKLNERVEQYKQIMVSNKQDEGKPADGSNDTNSTDNKRLDSEINELKSKIIKLQTEITSKSTTNDLLRTTYQAKSSEAAELSSSLLALTKKHDLLQTESKGLFKQLKSMSITSELKEYSTRLNNLSEENLFLENYMGNLNVILSERQKQFSSHHHGFGSGHSEGGNGRAKASRGSRGSTPHS